LDRAATDVLAIRNEAESGGAHPAILNYITAVYNDLVDLIHPNEYLFPDDISERLSEINDKIDAGHADHPAAAGALSSALHKLTVHANFVAAYGMEHDK
jgi:hypothetical protein